MNVQRIVDQLTAVKLQTNCAVDSLDHMFGELLAENTELQTELTAVKAELEQLRKEISEAQAAVE